MVKLIKALLYFDMYYIIIMYYMIKYEISLSYPNDQNMLKKIVKTIPEINNKKIKTKSRYNIK